eukprot:scaffold660820_cov59-Prasinocladus_malaysianus.AAC.1
MDEGWSRNSFEVLFFASAQLFEACLASRESINGALCWLHDSGGRGAGGRRLLQRRTRGCHT